MARVRSKVNALARLLASCPCPIYAIDEQRKIVYCNPACGELVGLDSDLLISQRCDYHTPGEGTTPADIAAGLCPPPEVFSGKLSTTEVTILHASGKLITSRAEYLPLGRDQLHCVGVLAILWGPEAGGASSGGGDSESGDLHRRLVSLRREILADCPLEELVGVSPAIGRVRRQILLAAQGETHVLVHGPSGSGREHVARLVHHRAVPDAVGPLVPLCCPLLDAELLQSTIAAFVRQLSPTPDGRTSKGRAPTILLLEVDQLVDEAQGELAGLLTLPSFGLCSVATATCSLFELAEQGRFRLDLAHALSTLVIEMPALIHRREDIPLLCQFFLEKRNAAGNRQLSGFTPKALDELYGYGWPENVDELAEIVEQACLQADGPFIEASDLPPQIHWATSADAHPRRQVEPIVLDEFLAQIEEELIARAMKQAKGNKTKAAQLLGITRARLHRRLDYFKEAGG